jgi:transcriptional regulator with XRE-family HTH domain
MPKSVFSDAYAIFLRALVAARKDAGVSQVELARRVGRDQPFISLVENGVRRVDLIEFYVLARGIGIDPVALFAAIASELPNEIEI